MTNNPLSRSFSIVEVLAGDTSGSLGIKRAVAESFFSGKFLRTCSAAFLPA